MPKKKIGKRGLVKKGQSLQGSPGFKFESAHLTERETEKAEGKLLDNPRVKEVKTIGIPKQNLVFARKGKRITPKTPRLRK